MILRTSQFWPLFLISSAAFCQGSPSQSSGIPTGAAEKGLKLSTQLQVNANVSVEAILLPPNVTRGVFGRAVSDRYAAVQLIVSNRSSDAALIVHSVFLDYSRWLLSSASLVRDTPDCAKVGTKGESVATMPECFNQLDPWQSSSRASQIASAEYRVPRGQLLQAQPWSARNLTIRFAELAGTIAAGYVFSLREPGFAKGVAAYNGNFLPGLRYLLPDSSIEQANRISDLGFRVNKVIPKESSEVVVAFFPIDRFLTPGLKKLFNDAPAIFFVPEAAAVDPKALNMLAKAIPQLGEDQNWKKELIDAIRSGEPNKTTAMFDRLSMNRIRLVVGGSMVIDADAAPASIGGVQFDEKDGAMLWAEPGSKTGTVSGSFLSGGKLVVTGSPDVTDVAVVQQGSTSSTLRFTFKLNKPLSEGQKLTFRVDKENQAKKIIEGVAFDYAVSGSLLTAPAIDKVERSGDTLTITGKRFFSTSENPLSVKFIAGAVQGVADVVVKNFERTPTQVTIDIAPLKLSPACWGTSLNVGTMAAINAAKPFAQAPVPKIASAKKNGARVVALGEQFVNLASCGKETKFEIAEQSAGSSFKAVENLISVSAKEVSFDLPKTPVDGKFKIRITVGGVELDTKNVE